MTTASAATTATFARASFIHHQRPAEKIFAIQRSNRLFRFAIITKLGETKSARLTCESIAKQSERIRLESRLCKQRLHLLFRGLEGQIPHIEFLHGRTP